MDMESCTKPIVVSTLFIYFLKDLISSQMSSDPGLTGMGEMVRVGFLSRLKSEGTLLS